MLKPFGEVLRAALPVAILLAWPTGARADEAADQKARCATRLSISMLGTSPASTLLSAPNPQASVDQMLTTPEFIERFARFVNSTFNDAPGDIPTEDASYWLAKEVLSKGLPWKEMFVGQYDIVRSGQGAQATATVQPNATGLGYFRAQDWLLRYAGNEPAGLKISTGYRMMHNVIGLRLTATTNAPGADITATGRQAAACAGCHFSSAFALDKVAMVLTRRTGTGANITFTPSPDPPQMVLGGLTIRDDAELVNALVNSDSYRFNACRLVFQFLYGRAESQCEAPVFDSCMTAMSTTGTMQAALAAVAKDPGFCQ